MNYTEQDKNSLKAFFVACDEMIEGRFILSDIKIARILKSIAKSELLYNLFAKCLLNFNFRRELQNAITDNKVNGGYFVLPTDEKRIIALVFCLLLEVDKGKMNLQSFINENFFSPDGYNISYSNFSINVLVPFKNSVKNLLNVDDDGNTLEREDDEQQSILEEPAPIEHTSREMILYANLSKSLNVLYSAVKRDPKLKEEQRQEVIIVMNAIHEAIKLQNLKIINALVIPLEYQIGKIKTLKNYYEDFKGSLVSFYYN